MKFKIRQTDDLDDILEIDREVFHLDVKVQGPQLLDAQWWLVHAWGDTGQGSSYYCQLAGYAGVYINPEGSSVAELVRAGVRKEYRGHGLQRRLIRVREAYAKAHGATTMETYIATCNIRSARSLIACGYLPTKYEKTASNAFITYSKSLT